MGKRSDFERVEKDFYRTIDERAITALKPHIKDINSYAEPCCGEMDMVKFLSDKTHLYCHYHSDITLGKDALELTNECVHGIDSIITNPPWSRPILHKMIMHFKDLKPTWLLFDADWAHTKQAIQYLKYCTDIVSIGRLIWIPGTKMTGKDNCCWYRFDKEVSEHITFHPKI